MQNSENVPRNELFAKTAQGGKKWTDKIEEVWVELRKTVLSNHYWKNRRFLCTRVEDNFSCIFVKCENHTDIAKS